MDTLFLLCTSLGFGSFSGLNLYLATFITGMAIRFNFIQVHEHLHQLDVLASPWIIWVAGILYAVEFIADKVPLIDSIWDTVHTAIRPVGAMALSLGFVGAVSGEWSVLAALLAGTASLTTHTAKMGTRLVANASPEPVSNSILSVCEDGVVVLGTIFLLEHPLITAGFCLLAVIGLLVIIPKLFRKVGGVFKAIRSGFSRVRKSSLPRRSPRLLLRPAPLI